MAVTVAGPTSSKASLSVHPMSTHPATCLIAPANRLKPEPVSEALGLVKDQKKKSPSAFVAVVTAAILSSPCRIHKPVQELTGVLKPSALVRSRHLRLVGQVFPLYLFVFLKAEASSSSGCSRCGLCHCRLAGAVLSRPLCLQRASLQP